MKVHTTSKAIQLLTNKEITIKEALEKKYITYEGVGFLKKLKFGLIKTVDNWF